MATSSSNSAVGAVPTTGALRTESNASEEPAIIRVGMAGAGPWAGMFTAPMLASAPGLSLTAVWARRPAAAEALAHQHGATAMESFDDLLATCDAVAFTVPAAVQASLAVTAARAGKHLLLEKPVGFTVSDAEAVAAAVDAAGVATQLMLTYRFTKQVRAFLRATADTQVNYVRAGMFGGSALEGSPFATPWRQAAGAALFDLGPHTLDLIEATAGAIVQLRAAESGGVLIIATSHADGAATWRRPSPHPALPDALPQKLSPTPATSSWTTRRRTSPIRFSTSSRTSSCGRYEVSSASPSTCTTVLTSSACSRRSPRQSTVATLSPSVKRT
jgi:hypothetical protein